jgi:UDP-glucose 4-epimerase
MKKILITGGAGYIGSHCTISLVEQGYKPIIIDNFSNSQKNVINKLELITKSKIIFYNIDLRDKIKISSIFRKHRFYAVIHCAALKSIPESIKNPLTYFDNNIQATQSLLECMHQQKIFNLIYSSSATVYDSGQSLPLKETAKTGETSNPYGTSKYIVERMLIDISQMNFKWRIGIARYFNPISNHFSGLIKDNPQGLESNLIPYIVKVAQKKLPYLKIYGKNYNTKDGTCIRDYVHVMDLADAHVAMLKNIKKFKNVDIYNIGTGKGSTVLEVVRAFEKETGIAVPFKFVKRRRGDVASSFCNPIKAFKRLSWKATHSLNSAMSDIKSTIREKKFKMRFL